MESWKVDENILKESESLMLTMKYERDKYAKLYELAYNDYVKTIKENVSYFPIIRAVYKHGREWLTFCKLNQKDKDFSKEKLYEFKKGHDIILEILTKTFGVDTIFINDIITEGHEDYAIDLYFSYKNTNYVFIIPNTENVNIKNIVFTNYARLQIGIVNPNTIEIFESSYNVEDIVNAFKKREGLPI